MSDIERFRDENYLEEQPHSHMESAVGISMSYHFGYRFLQQGLFTESQWQTVREIIERYFGFQNIDTALQYEIERLHDGLPRNPGISTYQSDIDEGAERKNTDTAAPDAKLPAGWLSVLEAAYEHQNDTRALLRFATYAILSDISPAERYLQMAKSLAADDWKNVREHITELFTKYGEKLFPLTRNRAYERLLVQEQLSEPAWQYLQHLKNIDDSNAVFFGDRDPQRRDMLNVLAPVVAKGHAEEIVAELMQPLCDADNKLLKEDTADHRIEIATILDQCMSLGAQAPAQQRREKLRLMYPRRQPLQQMLDAVMNGDFNRYDPRWQENVS